MTPVPALALLALLALPPATGLACRVVPVEGHRAALHAVGSGLTALAALLLVLGVVQDGGVTVANGLLAVDPLSAFFIGLVALVALTGGLYAPGYLRRDVEQGELEAARTASFYLWYHLFVWTMLLAAAVNNLGLLWVAIEATTVVSAVLVGFYRSKAALEAAWKYLMLCSVGIVIALFGVLLVYSAVSLVPGAGGSLQWADLTAIAPQLDRGYMKLALVFVVIGFGTKAGLAPMHAWLPDAHSQAPAPASAVLSGALLSCALYGIIRTVAIAAPSVGPELPRALLLGFGMGSLALSVPFLLIQRDLKRLLAYSSVEHIGLSALALGIGGPLGLYAALLHLFNHALAKSFLFLVAGEIVQRYGTRRIGSIRGLITAAPAMGTLLVLGGLAITGLPPMGLFVSELSIFVAGVERSLWWVVAAALTLLALAFMAMAHHTGAMAFGPAQGRVAPGRASALQCAALALPLALLLVLGVTVPEPLAALLHQAAAQLAPHGKPLW